MSRIERSNWRGEGSNFRYVTALMVEARVRGFEFFEHQDILDLDSSFCNCMEAIADWLEGNFPEEFKEVNNG